MRSDDVWTFSTPGFDYDGIAVTNRLVMWTGDPSPGVRFWSFRFELNGGGSAMSILAALNPRLPGEIGGRHVELFNLYYRQDTQWEAESKTVGYAGGENGFSDLIAKGHEFIFDFLEKTIHSFSGWSNGRHIWSTPFFVSGDDLVKNCWQAKAGRIHVAA